MIDEVRREIHEIRKVVGDLVSAIQGNHITRDGGLTGRIMELEQSHESLKTDIVKIKESNIEKNIQVKILWASLGTIVGLIVAYVFQAIFSK